MKLKTLKEMDNEDDHSDGTCGAYEWRIRQEAIKWIKELDKDSNIIKFDSGHEIKWEGPGAAVQDIYLMQVWIRNFFNITEEDLK